MRSIFASGHPLRFCSGFCCCFCCFMLFCHRKQEQEVSRRESPRTGRSPKIVGVTKETVFFLFATIQTSISCSRVESLHGLDHHVEYLSGTRSSNTVGAGTGRRPPARQHSTGLLADHAYYTAALQPVAYLGGARRRNSERVGTCVLGGLPSGEYN